MKTLKHTELNGNCTQKKKIIIDACEIEAGNFEVMALYADGEELDCLTSETESEAIQHFNTLINKYAGNLQKAICNANLVKGGKYTLVYCNELGFPVAEKITFNAAELCTYAQYSDCVKMTFTPYRARKMHGKYFYNSSLLIFKGWQELNKKDLYITIRENSNCKLLQSKYGCFDSRYIDDMEKCFKNPVVTYKNYKTGVNGKLYA